ncbi:MAG: hypothetical protein K6G62_03735, partial [Eubacterium sp.]|nr:hypothetical protein [Eubacterium sp.]
MAHSHVYAADVTYKNGSSLENVVGVMQSYGFVAFDTLATQGHQHANALAKNLGNDYSSSLSSELNIRKTSGYSNPYTTTYIENFANLSGEVKIGTAGDTLVVGSSYEVTSEGTNSYYINEKDSTNKYKVDAASNVSADTETEKFIDIDNLQQSFISYNKQLAASNTNSGITARNSQTYDV